jgi:hypothetical protein
MRARSCGPPLRLPAGTQRVRARAGRLRVDKLLLTSPAPAPVARASGRPGRVTNVGRPGRGKRDGVRLSLHAPAWLVLGESFARGWRASCDGHSLGPPVPLDGYANAWRVGPDCHRASFEFAPQRPVRIVQLLSALACLVLLAIALSTARQGPDLRPAVDCRPAAPPSRPSPRQALVAGLALGAVLAFCFSLRSGLVIAPALALVLWRGIPAGPLAVAAGLLLGLVVPLLYALVPSDDHGGYNPGYAGDHVAGHWVAVAAWVLLALALWRTISTARAAAARAPRSAP